MLKRDVRRLYLYAVCLVSLVVILVSLVNLAGLVAEAAMPVPPPAPLRPPPGESQDGFQAQAEEEQIRQMAWERRAQAAGVARNATALIVGCFLYLSHWRLIRREESDG